MRVEGRGAILERRRREFQNLNLEREVT